MHTIFTKDKPQGFLGRTTVKVVPSRSGDRTVIDPWCARTISFAMNSPSPMPFAWSSRYVLSRSQNVPSTRHLVLQHQPLRTAAGLECLFERELGQSNEILAGDGR